MLLHGTPLPFFAVFGHSMGLSKQAQHNIRPEGTMHVVHKGRVHHAIIKSISQAHEAIVGGSERRVSKAAVVTEKDDNRAPPV